VAAYPTVDEVRAWIGAHPDEITDAQLAVILQSEIEIQAAYCVFIPAIVPNDEIPTPMYQALLRRCAREVAARGVPLGSLPAPQTGVGAEYGVAGVRILPRYDAEIDRLEAPYRVAGIA
jgi:hypothetical protein